MADGTSLNSMSGGDKIQTEDFGAAGKVERVKIVVGALDVDGGDVSSTNPIPVTLANTGANATAVKVDNSAVTQPVSGTFWQATQPVSAASLPLPTGASTAAKQPALGTAGIPSADVLSVQGVTSMTPLKVDGSGVTQPVSGTVSVNALPAGTNIVGKFTTDQTTHGTSDLVAADITKVGGATITLAAKTSANSFPVVLASDQAAIPVTQSGTWTVQPGNTQNTTAWLTQSKVGTSNGWTPYKLISAATTNATNVKASAGNLGGIQVYGNTATVYYLKLYNKASAPTVGTDTPVKVIIIPANSTNGAGSNITFGDAGLSFATGISFAITGAITDADTTACAANAVVVNLDYN